MDANSHIVHNKMTTADVQTICSVLIGQQQRAVLLMVFDLESILRPFVGCYVLAHAGIFLRQVEKNDGLSG